MSYIVDRSHGWKHVDGVVDAKYTRPDGTEFDKVKVRIGSKTIGDFVDGIGSSVSVVRITVWPKSAGGNEDPVNTLESQGEFFIDGTTYQIVRVDTIRPDGSQWIVSCKVHQ